MRRNELPLELKGADNPDGEEHPGRGLDEMGSELDDDLEAALERGESDWEAVEGSDDDGRAPGERLDADEPDDGDFDAAGARSDAAAVGRCCPLSAASLIRRRVASMCMLRECKLQGLSDQVRRGDLVAVRASLCAFTACYATRSDADAAGRCRPPCLCSCLW